MSMFPSDGHMGPFKSGAEDAFMDSMREGSHGAGWDGDEMAPYYPQSGNDIDEEFLDGSYDVEGDMDSHAEWPCSQSVVGSPGQLSDVVPYRSS